MNAMKTNSSMSRKIEFRFILIFATALLVSILMIYFGSRNDAITIAQHVKSGVLTADEVNIAFESVGGKLVSRQVNESQWVKKGDVLMVIDATDTKLSIDRLKATINALKAQLRQEDAAINIAMEQNKLSEKSSWRKIEETQSALKAAKANVNLARAEYNRFSQLIKSSHVSLSQLDTVRNTLVQAESLVTQTERQLASLIVGATASQSQLLEKTGKAEGMILQEIVNTREEINNRKNTLDQLNAQLKQSETDLKQQEINLERLTLTAPEDGKILKVLYEPGEILPVGTTAVLLETERKYFDIYVDENRVSTYQPNSQVEAEIPALNNEKVKGIVRFATAAPSFSDLRMTRERGQADLTSFQVRIYTEPKPTLLTGMTLEVVGHGQ